MLFTGKAQREIAKAETAGEAAALWWNDDLWNRNRYAGARQPLVRPQPWALQEQLERFSSSLSQNVNQALEENDKVRLYSFLTAGFGPGVLLRLDPILEETAVIAGLSTRASDFNWPTCIVEVWPQEVEVQLPGKGLFTRRYQTKIESIWTKQS